MWELRSVSNLLIVVVLFSHLKRSDQQQSSDPRWLIYTLEREENQ